MSNQIFYAEENWFEFAFVPFIPIMKNQFYCSILFFCFIATSENIFAQESSTINNTWKDSATIYIHQLKDGALVVRLKTKSKAISVLRNEGREQDALKIETLQLEENLLIKKAFDSLYTFSKVYFCYTDSTDALLSGKQKGIFLNNKLEVDITIAMNETFFLIAEKGTTTIETKYDPTNQQQAAVERGNFNETIIILDKQLRQMKDPFPYYAKESFLKNFKKNDWNAKVKSINQKFFSFYKSTLK